MLLASEAGQLPIVRELLGLHADIDRFNAAHDTPLHVAATKGHAEVCVLVRGRGGGEGGGKSAGVEDQPCIAASPRFPPKLVNRS